MYFMRKFTLMYYNPYIICLVKELDTLERPLRTCFYYNYDIGNATY